MSLAPQPESGRAAGLLLPLFSMPSSRSWGIGELADLPALARWMLGAGLRVLQVLPLNEMAPGQASPYPAVSAMALDEKNMVDWPDVAPKLLLTTAPDWQVKAVWFHGVQEDAKAFAVTPELKRVADEVTAGLDRADDKAAALTHWVAENIRYIGLAHGQRRGVHAAPRGEDAAPPGRRLQDKAGILTALLRAAGLEAYAGMTMAGEKIEKLAADQFNHCITVWRRPDGATQLLDPTWVPGARELWSSREQQQEVLMGLPEGADIITTPISPPSDHSLSRVNSRGKMKGGGSPGSSGQTESSWKNTVGLSSSPVLSVWRRGH